MNQTLKCCAIICTFLLFTAELSAQNKNTPDIGFIPFFKMGDNLLIINASEGELVSVTSVGETIFAATINEDENVFYMLTYNNLYKGDIETGDIIDKYKFNDLDFNDPDPMIKSACIPFAITQDGRAFYIKRGTSTESYFSEMKLYLADINTKTSSFLYDDVQGFPHLVKENGKITGFVIIDYENLLIKYIDLSGKEKSSVNIPDLIERQSYLENYELKQILNNAELAGYRSLLTLIFQQKQEDDIFESEVYVIYDFDNNKIIYNEKYDNPTRWNFPYVAGINTNDSTYYFAEVVQTGESDPHNYDNYKAVIYGNPELESAIIEIPKARFVSIHNNIYALVRREYELELINIETKETVWKIDTDF